MPNRAVQIDYLFGPVRKVDPMVVATGAVVAYIADAREASGALVFRRATNLWADPDRKLPFVNGIIKIGAAGLPVDPLTNETLSVYGDGSYVLHFYDDGSNAPSGSETENPKAFSDPSDPDHPNPDRVEVFHTSHDVVNVRHFGAQGTGDPRKPGTGADDTLALQNAIDYCLRPAESGEYRQRVLYIPAGTYRITKTLLVQEVYTDMVVDPNNPGGTIAVEKFTFCNIQIHGEKIRSDAAVDVLIYAEFLDGPAIAIQAGRGVIIRHLGITGLNRVDDNYAAAAAKPPGGLTYSYAAMLDDNLFYYDWTSHPWGADPPVPSLVGRCRDNRQSPHAAIAIDPFAGEGTRRSRDIDVPTGGVPGACQYPNLTKWYKLHDYVFSSAILIEGCAFARFVVGVVVGPTGNAANAENIVIRNTHFESVKIAIATAVTQSRGFGVEACDVNLCQFVLDNRTYGAGQVGAPPNVRGLAVSQAKYLFNLDMGSTSLALDQIYAESLLGLGFLGTSRTNDNSVVFTGCDFSFHVSHPMIDVHLYSYANIAFIGCLFHISDEGGSRSFPPIRFANRGPLRFTSCVLRTAMVGPDPVVVLLGGTDNRWLHGQPNWGFEEPSLCSFDGVTVLDNYTLGTDQSKVPNNARLTFLRQSYAGVDGSVQDRKDLNVAAGLMRQHLPPGAVIAPSGTGDSRDTIHVRHVSGRMNRIPLSTDSAPLKILLVTGTDTVYFLGFVGQVLPGDIVYFATSIDNPGWPDGWGLPVYAPSNPGDSVGNIAINPDFAYPNIAPIGCVTRIANGKNYIDCAPRALVNAILASGNAELFGDHERFTYVYAVIRRFGRYHVATTGNWTSVPTQTIYVTVDNNYTLRSVWKKGDRISTDLLTGAGTPYIPPGTYVEQVTQNGTFPYAGILTLSKVLQTATPSGVNVRLYDADVFRVALTPE